MVEPKVKYPGIEDPDEYADADESNIYLHVVNGSRLKSFNFHPKGSTLKSLFIAACHSFKKNPDKMCLIRAKNQHEYTLDELHGHAEWRGLEHDEYLYLREKRYA